MTPQDLQAAAVAIMQQQKAGGGQANPAMQQQGGYGPMNRVTSMIPPVMPGTRIEEDMPQWDARTMGNQMGGPPPASGAGGPLDFGAIMRRMLGNMSGPPGGAGTIPGGDTTARPGPGDHIGLSELAQGSLLDQIMQRLKGSQGSQGPQVGVRR
jgi:hypothetical protein